MPHPFRLDGKIALITGAASGIGEATARTFADAGARVLLVDLNEERVRQVGSSIANSAHFACDVTNEEQVERLFASIHALDIVVNCAGVGMVGSIEETSLPEFQRLLRVNVEGTFLVTKAALPLL